MYMSMSVCVHDGCLCCGYISVYMCDVYVPACMYYMCVPVCVSLSVYCMCVWSSAWEVGQGGDFLLAPPLSDHIQAHSPAPPWR